MIEPVTNYFNNNELGIILYIENFNNKIHTLANVHELLLAIGATFLVARHTVYTRV